MAVKLSLDMLEDNQNQIPHRKKIIKMNRISNGLFYISVAFNAKERDGTMAEHEKDDRY